MKILEVVKMESFKVETDEDEVSTYIRYSKNSWFVKMGESDESVYDCEELEKLYQEYMINKNSKR